jgi:hypothetical protein
MDVVDYKKLGEREQSGFDMDFATDEEHGVPSRRFIHASAVQYADVKGHPKVSNSISSLKM